MRVNFGQMKDMQVAGEAAPKRFVYAMTGAARGVPASGWVPLDAVVDKANLVKMGSHAARVVRSLAKTSYVVKAAEDWNQSPQTYDHELLPAWTKATLGKASKHVIPQAGDYLLRTGNVINLIYSTPGAGGASTDTFVVEKDRLAFARAKSTAARPTLVRVGVADPKRKSMVFAYGSIAGRFGWLALDAIKSGNVVSVAAPRAEVASGTPSVCDGKPNGTACSDVFPNEAHTCRDGQLIESLACPPPQTHCVGVSADAQIICAE